MKYKYNYRTVFDGNHIIMYMYAYEVHGKHGYKSIYTRCKHYYLMITVLKNKLSLWQNIIYMHALQNFLKACIFCTNDRAVYFKEYNDACNNDSNYITFFSITEVAFGCPTWYYASNYIGGCVCGSELGESATSISIEFDEAFLNLVVLDSVQNESMIASRSFRIDFRTHGRPAATRDYPQLPILFGNHYYFRTIPHSVHWVVRAPISVLRRIFPRVSAIRLGTRLISLSS